MTECEKCEGKMYYIVPNHQHDILERVECWDCISVDMYNNDVKERISRQLVNASKERLANIIAELMVNATEDDKVDETFEPLIATKDTTRLLVIGRTIAEMV